MSALKRAALLAKIALEDIKSEVFESEWDSHYSLQAQALRALDEALQQDLKSKCDMILHAMLGPNQIEGWWNSPNKAFDMKPAKEMFEEDSYRVYQYLLNQVQR